jgi:hypothetical protein
MRLSGRFWTCCASHSRYHLKSSKLVTVRRVDNSSLLDELGKYLKIDRIDESTLETGIATGYEPASSQWMVIITGSSATEKCYKGARVTVMRSPTIAPVRSSALASNRDNGESPDAPHLPDMVQKRVLTTITKGGTGSREDEEVNGMGGKVFLRARNKRTRTIVKGNQGRLRHITR